MHLGVCVLGPVNVRVFHFDKMWCVFFIPNMASWTMVPWAVLPLYERTIYIAVYL